MSAQLSSDTAEVSVQRRYGVSSRGMFALKTLPALIDEAALVFGYKSDEVDAVLAWGRKPSALRAEIWAQRNDRPVLWVEDGFLRSVGLGTDEPPLSIVVDDVGIYYDANMPSRLEKLVQRAHEPAELERAAALIHQWREAQVSKYNHAPESVPSMQRPYVLVVDQTAGDASIVHGQADASSFTQMLEAAIQEYPRLPILLKVHPDVAAGYKRGHFTRLKRRQAARVTVVTDVHPCALLENCVAVYTVTSQLGFEALLWNKPVRCFGMPFYAGWGLTLDELPAPERRAAEVPRTLEDLVHAALIEYPRYLDPDTGQRCEVERLVEWLALQRRMRWPTEARSPETQPGGQDTVMPTDSQATKAVLTWAPVEPQAELTVIIPIRCAKERMDAIERLSYITLDTQRTASIAVLIVDDGSPAPLSEQLAARAEALGFNYTRIDSEYSTFSIGRARNVGAQHARSRFILFQDVDLMPYPGFYKDVLREIRVQKLDKFAERFLTFGVIYLTKDATTEYLSTEEDLRKDQFIQYLLEDDKRRIEKFSTGTSVNVWSRSYFLSAGGNDLDFEGWGYEDIEFMCRSLRRGRRFPLPEEFSLDYKNSRTITEYRGWKSVYRLFGDMTFQKGMILFHAWHPVESNTNYAKSRERNGKIFNKKLTDFNVHGLEPEALPMPERGRSLIFRRNPWVYNRWTAPLLGEIFHLDETIVTPESVIAFIKANDITRVVFHNPYSSERMQLIYEAVKKEGIEFLVCERGALPNSIFFDSRGFNGESSSYDPQFWRHKLTPQQEAETIEYIRDYKFKRQALEAQSDSIGPRQLRRKLNLPPNQKVLFVPLQRPSDTVIKHLAGSIGSYDDFMLLVRRISYLLPPDWTVVCKTHPLEDPNTVIGDAVIANNANINDLLEMSDAVLLINSGVGVLGMMYGKPVLYAGKAFYGHPGIACHVVSDDDVLDAIRTFKPDQEAILQFLHYLVFEFYSFGEFKTRSVAWEGNSKMTATTDIAYSVIRIPGCASVSLERRTDVEIKWESVLFDRYRNAAVQATRFQAPATPKPSAVQEVDATDTDDERASAAPMKALDTAAPPPAVSGAGAGAAETIPAVAHETRSTARQAQPVSEGAPRKALKAHLKDVKEATEQAQAAVATLGASPKKSVAKAAK